METKPTDDSVIYFAMHFHTVTGLYTRIHKRWVGTSARWTEKN